MTSPLPFATRLLLIGMLLFATVQLFADDPLVVRDVPVESVSSAEKESSAESDPGSLEIASSPINPRLVESGEKALRDYPWYDAEKHELNPVTLKSSTGDAAHRDSTWKSNWPEWNWPDWDLSWMGPFAQFLGYLILVLLVVGIVALIVRLIQNAQITIATGVRHEDEEIQRRGDIDRVEALPFPVLRQRGDLLEAARQAYQAGRFDDAMVCLFSYFLVQMDRAQMLRLERGKTNRQYLREVGGRSQAGSILEPAMLAFEDVYFGHHALDRSRFESSWNRLDEFHELVRKGTS